MSDPLARLLPRNGDSAPTSPVEPPIDTGHHRLTFLGEVEPTLRAMFDDIAHARRRVAIGCFIVRDDRLGRALGEALVEAARRGCEVRLLYDALGSKDTDPKFFASLCERGVVCRAYRPRRVQVRTLSFGPREHSRVIYMDDVAYAGGIAFGDEWLSSERGGHGWHDVCVRVDGPCAEHFVTAFDQRWREADGQDSTPEDVCEFGECDELSFVADSCVGDSKVYDLHRQAIQRARSRVWVENAYFYPPPSLLQDFVDAVRRGVDVRVLVPGVTDLPFMQHAGRAEYSEWIAHGVRVFEYQQRVMHAKFAVIDDDWVSVGSFNACPPGLWFANELNVFVNHTGFNARAARQFEQDVARSVEFTVERARARPILHQVRDQLASDALTVLDALREKIH